MSARPALLVIALLLSCGDTRLVRSPTLVEVSPEELDVGGVLIGRRGEGAIEIRNAGRTPRAPPGGVRHRRPMQGGGVRSASRLRQRPGERRDLLRKKGMRRAGRLHLGRVHRTAGGGRDGVRRMVSLSGPWRLSSRRVRSCAALGVAGRAIQHEVDDARISFPSSNQAPEIRKGTNGLQCRATYCRCGLERSSRVIEIQTRAREEVEVVGRAVAEVEPSQRCASGQKHALLSRRELAQEILLELRQRLAMWQ